MSPDFFLHLHRATEDKYPIHPKLCAAGILPTTKQIHFTPETISNPGSSMIAYTSFDYGGMILSDRDIVVPGNHDEERYADLSQMLPPDTECEKLQSSVSEHIHLAALRDVDSYS